jgi:hypothetical protein
VELGNIFNIPRAFLPLLEQNKDVAFWQCVLGNLVSRVWDNLGLYRDVGQFRALLSETKQSSPIVTDAPQCDDKEEASMDSSSSSGLSSGWTTQLDSTLRDDLDTTTSVWDSDMSVPDSVTNEVVYNRMSPQIENGDIRKGQGDTAFDFSVAVKSDDAAIPTFIWDTRIWNLGFHCPVRVNTFKLKFGRCALEAVRSFFFRC